MARKKILNEMYSDFSLFWQKISPPWRPSLRECLFADEQIREKFKGKPVRALILGATPEWRDLLYMNGADTTLLDAKIEMVKSMSYVRYYSGVNEEVVFGNWLAFPSKLKPNSFDVIISDRPHDNIPFKDWPKLWKNIQRVLKPSGIFLLAVSNNDFSKNKFTVAQLLKMYRKDKNLFKFHWQRVIYFYGLIAECSAYNKKTYVYNFPLCRQNFIKKAKRLGATKAEMRAMWLMPADFDKQVLGNLVEVLPPLKVLLKSLRDSGFKVKKIMKDTSAEYMHIKRLLCLTK